jgi:hypothetical protein
VSDSAITDIRNEVAEKSYSQRIAEGLCVACGDPTVGESDDANAPLKYFIELRQLDETPPYSRFHLICFSRQDALSWLSNRTVTQSTGGSINH